MRYLIISDIHGNLEALDAVVGAMKPLGYDKVLVLGDLVGYGADPNAVIDRVRELEPFKIIRGNHDKVAAGLEDGESFNIVARSAVQWTHDTLTPGNRDYLLRVVAADLSSYEAFLKNKLTRLDGIASIESSFALAQAKYTNVLPIG